MSKRVDICDVCQSRWPEYHFRYKAWKWEDWPSGPEKIRYDVCDGCWKALRMMVSKED